MNFNININGVPETMLWTLHNRASEALLPDAIIQDELCIEIYKSIPYDYEKNFGKPDYSHGFRSWFFDQQLKEWLQKHPGGIVLEMGAGLETQFFRIQDPSVRWYVIDVPESIAIRKKYIPEHKQLTNIAKSALDFTWLDDVPESEDGHAFISFQGLLMYFNETDVKELLQRTQKKYPNATMVFDTIPRWLSKKATQKSWKKTPSYTTPPMPWGINRDEIQATMQKWLPTHDQFFDINYSFRRWIHKGIYLLISIFPPLKRISPGIIRISRSSIPSKRQTS